MMLSKVSILSGLMTYVMFIFRQSNNIEYFLLDHQEQINRSKHPSSDGNEELYKEPSFHEWIQAVLILV